jgi:two-component system NarL family response regulator
MREHQATTTILIAGSSADLLTRWEQALQGIAAVRAVGDIYSLSAVLKQAAPQLLLLDIDLPGFGGPDAVGSLRNSNPATRIVVLSGPISDDTELALFKAGARGCCQRDIAPQLLKRVVVAIQVGELWIRRSLTPRLLDELGASSRGAGQPRPAVIASRLAYLTSASRNCALIANGGTNKQIARQLAISERTVKAHLTEIFRKLGIRPAQARTPDRGRRKHRTCDAVRSRWQRIAKIPVVQSDLPAGKGPLAHATDVTDGAITRSGSPVRLCEPTEFGTWWAPVMDKTLYQVNGIGCRNH